MYIVNGTIYTMDSQNTIIEKGAIRIQDGILVDIGDIPVEPEAGEEVIDALGGWILPGFVEAHCHIGIQEENGVLADIDMSSGKGYYFFGGKFYT